jgi:hypothetical protein
MRKIIWLLPLLGALAGGFIILATMGLSKGAPQEAAGYAMACAFAVVPYVLARSFAAMSDNDAHIELKRIVNLMEQQQKQSGESS